ncbi:MAG: hypothetical protein WD278_17180, partial [Pirellulales bacterium]
MKKMTKTRVGWCWAGWLLPAMLLAAAGKEAGAAEEERRPNILFAFADDWGRYASAYADVDGEGGINDV